MLSTGVDSGYLDLVVGPAYSNPNYTLAAAAAAIR